MTAKSRSARAGRASGTPAIHHLLADNLSAAPAVLEQPGLGQRHELAADDVAGAAPPVPIFDAMLFDPAPAPAQGPRPATGRTPTSLLGEQEVAKWVAEHGGDREGGHAAFQAEAAGDPPEISVRSRAPGVAENSVIFRPR